MQYLVTLLFLLAIAHAIPHKRTASSDHPCYTSHTPSIAVFIFYDIPDSQSESSTEANTQQLLGCLSNIADAKATLVDPFSPPGTVLAPAQQGRQQTGRAQTITHQVSSMHRLHEHSPPFCRMDKIMFIFDVYLGFSESVPAESEYRQRVKESIVKIDGVNNVFLASNALPTGSHMRSFFELMHMSARKSNTTYDYIFTTHTNADRRMIKHSLESLCGTPAQVASVLGVLMHTANDTDVDILTAQGLALTRDTPVVKMAPFLLDVLHENLFVNSLKRRIDATAEPLSEYFKTFLGLTLHIPVEKLILIEGGACWVRRSLLTAQLVSRFQEYTHPVGSRLEGVSILDLLLPALSLHLGHRVATMIPAPKPLSIYFPQYHSIPENDRFWGENFTEWTLLKPLDLPLITKPLDLKEGGLGYYNLTSRKIRLLQGLLNKQHGGHGFVYYHYWFCGEGAPLDHKILYKIPELMMLDGEPNTPFMFSWANEPWTRRWTGKTKDTMLAQDYGAEKEWREHFDYLVPFFRHRNYIRINGMPVFIIYRLDHIGRKLRPMLKLWNRMALDAGFSMGVYFMVTMGNFFNPNSENKVLAVPEVKAGFQFWPMITGNYPDFVHGTDLNMSIPQYWGSFTGFDPRPRRPTVNRRFDINPAVFEKNLKLLTDCSDVQRWRKLEDNYIFITAWNEWNEQAIMEPNTLYGNGFLNAMRYAMQTVPSCPI